MHDTKRIVVGLIKHLVLFLLSFVVLVGVIESMQLFVEDIPLVNAIILGFMVGHTMILWSVQIGVQILEIVRIKSPTLLISYYFRFDDNETIPIPLLDPTKNKIAVLTLFLVITGGPIIYPIFAVYGTLFMYEYLLVNPLFPSLIIEYFGIFLNWMPPIIGIILLILILSVVIVEFRHS
ncbi:MAG: hypothetical protein ACTSV2_10145 [Candidatus Thorarchaeota archaeon]